MKYTNTIRVYIEAVLRPYIVAFFGTLRRIKADIQAISTTLDGLGTASTRDVGTSVGNIPEVLASTGKLDPAIVPLDGIAALRKTYSLSALYQAINGTGGKSLVNAWPEAFESLERVNLARSSGYTYNEDTDDFVGLIPTGELQHPSSLVSTHEDLYSGYTVINLDSRLPNGATITGLSYWAMDTGPTTPSLFVMRRDGADSFTVVAEVAGITQAAGWSDYVSLSSAYTIPDAGDYYIGIYNAGGKIHLDATEDDVVFGSIGRFGKASGTNADYVTDITGGTGLRAQYIGITTYSITDLDFTGEAHIVISGESVSSADGLGKKWSQESLAHEFVVQFKTNGNGYASPALFPESGLANAESASNIGPTFVDAVNGYWPLFEDDGGFLNYRIIGPNGNEFVAGTTTGVAWDASNQIITLHRAPNGTLTIYAGATQIYQSATGLLTEDVHLAFLSNDDGSSEAHEYVQIAEIRSTREFTITMTSLSASESPAFGSLLALVEPETEIDYESDVTVRMSRNSGDTMLDVSMEKLGETGEGWDIIYGTVEFSGGTGQSIVPEFHMGPNVGGALKAMIPSVE